MLAYVLDAIEQAETIRETVLVAGEHTVRDAEALLVGSVWTKPIRLAIGGDERQVSVANGVLATDAESWVVAIHDGARPLVEASLFDRCARAAAEHGAAIAATPVGDTIKRVEGRRITGTVPRDDLWAAQTPQAFRRELIAAALDSDVARSHSFTDEAGLFEALGLPVKVVTGDRANLKITHAGDLAIAEALICSRIMPP